MMSAFADPEKAFDNVLWVPKWHIMHSLGAVLTASLLQTIT